MKNFNDKLARPMISGGVFTLKVYDLNGVLIEEYEDRNLVVSSGRDAAVRLLGSGTAGKQVTQISFGTNGADPLLSDTVISNEFKKAVAAVTYPSTDSVRFDFTLELAENNGVTIREFGLLCSDNSLFARKVRAPIDKDNTVRLEGFWTITF